MVTKPILPAPFTTLIARHHVLALATQNGDQLHVAPLFYAYDTERNLFIVASDPKTRHAIDVVAHPNVAASIQLETETVGKIEGLQIEGVMQLSDEAEDRTVYFRRFPYARAMAPVLWRIEPTYMKLTDNRLGFGTKLLWP